MLSPPSGAPTSLPSSAVDQVSDERECDRCGCSNDLAHDQVPEGEDLGAGAHQVDRTVGAIPRRR